MTEPTWRKSSYSDASGGDCVEVAASSDAVRVRDSKRVTGPALALAPDSWEAFVGGLKRGPAGGSGARSAGSR
ncbi:DUF397 domain-containing protein [Streptomyces ovatisporus]|uniref:DUF397 domain-containing protein n=1 Tax=Streptomyces ovatisporus TaxID=1128682 RepID=A0ABV9A301_9ACTN